MTDQALPVLQAAVDALYARINTGRAHSTGTAVASGLTGPITNLSPDDLAILTEVMSGRKSARMADIWSRDDLHVAGASEDDFALEGENAYQIISRGDTLGELMKLDGDDLIAALGTIATTTERIMRAGPYRSKWDTRRGAVSWLAQDCANAVQTTYERLKEYREQHPSFTLLLDDEDTSDAPAADETVEQEVARLRRELAASKAAHAQTRAINAVQMTNLRARTSERDDYRARALETAQVLRNPTLKPPEKIIAIALAWRVESAASRGQEEVRAFYPEIAEAVGMSADTVGKYVGTLSDRADAPLVKRTVTEWREIPDPETGQPISRPTSMTFVRARGEGSILSAVAAYRPEDRPKHGGARPRGCPDHPAADLIIRSTTHCAECDRQLGDPRETLRPQVAGVGDRRESSVYVVTNEPQVAVVGSETVSDDERAAKLVSIQLGATRLRLQDAPVRRIQFTRNRGQERPPDDPPPLRCVTKGCNALPGPSDGFYCPPCRAKVSGDEPFIPSSEWQEVPDGYPCPPGGEFRMDFKTGKNWARWRTATMAGGEE
jgi:hypothetical protein